MRKQGLALISVVIILISLFSFMAQAVNVEKFNIDFELPEDFIILTEDNIKSNSDAVKSLGFTNETFKNYIKSNNIVVFASLPDKSCQITVNLNTTDFTKSTENLEYLDDEYIARLLPKLINGKVKSNDIKIINGSKFIRIEKNGSDKAGDFSYLQYITVKNQHLYTITVSFSKSTLIASDIEFTDALMKGFTITETKQKVTLSSIQSITVYIVLVLVLLLLLTVCIYFIFTIISDIIKNRNTSDVAPYVKIKRRRFK